MTRTERKARTAGLLCCSFTGHRPGKLPYSLWDGNPQAEELKQKLSDAIDTLILEGFGHFVSGGALGIDTLAALLVLEKREANPAVTLEIAVPYPEQAGKWSEKDRTVYRDILCRADIVTVVSDGYDTFAPRRRNEFMLDLSDAVIAVFNGSPGGTSQAVSSAYDRGLRLILIKP